MSATATDNNCFQIYVGAGAVVGYSGDARKVTGSSDSNTVFGGRVGPLFAPGFGVRAAGTVQAFSLPVIFSAEASLPARGEVNASYGFGAGYSGSLTLGYAYTNCPGR